MDAQSPHPAELDARLRARRVERRAALLEEARGQGRWSSWLWGPIGLLAVVYLLWRAPQSELLALLLALLALFVMIGAVEFRLSRRLDAVVKLLEEEEQVAP